MRAMAHVYAHSDLHMRALAHAYTHSVKSSVKVETINAKRVSVCDSRTESLIFTPNMNQVLGLAG